MNMQVLDARRDLGGGYKVDVTRGERVGRVSSEWFSRPDDERFLSLGELARSVRDRSERSQTRVVETALIHVEASRTDPERLSLILPGAEAPVSPTHWSFGQLDASKNLLADWDLIDSLWLVADGRRHGQSIPWAL